jgi:hypothetical protein
MVPARWAAAGAAMACLALAAPARAQTTIDSADMEIDVGTAGELDGSFNSDGFGQVLTYGLAGLQIDLNDTTAIGIGQFTPVGQGAVGGSGTAADPYTVTTQFDATAGGATVLHVTEVVTHVNGDPRIPVELKLQNASGTAQKVRAVEWGEVAGGGFAQGTGTLLAGPPRYVAGVFPTTGSVSGLEQVTQWDHYQEADDATLSTQLSNASASLNDTVAATGGPHDPAVGAEWDRTLANGDTATLDVAWRFVPGAAHLDLAPGDGSGPPDQPACFTATVTTIYGAPLAGIPVDFDAGDPHPPLTAATNAAGQAAYCVTAAEPDEELFVDAEVADALLDGFSTWTFNGGASDTTGGGGTPPAPVAGSRVTARVVSGRVRLRHGTRYTTITGAQSIKVGSMLDARHGTVELTAAVHGRTQTGRFGAGIFRVRQATASAPVALFLAGPAFGPSCQAGSHKVVRRLRAVTAGGRWQTVARASTAGVTKAASWITRDRCDGTLTVVHKGAATVRDAHGHAFAVRAGRRRLVVRRSVRSG